LKQTIGLADPRSRSQRLIQIVSIAPFGLRAAAVPEKQTSEAVSCKLQQRTAPFDGQVATTRTFSFPVYGILQGQFMIHENGTKDEVRFGTPLMVAQAV
jgi:hypothetical protein